MKVLVLGGGGLIGHTLFLGLRERFEDVQCTLHGGIGHPVLDIDGVHVDVDVLDFPHLEGLLHALRPDVVLNCVGITRRKPQIEDAELAIGVNALFPHQLARWAARASARVIHFSTDCVFDGESGAYTEDSPTTGLDSYGRTKALGEIRYPHTLTIRSSFIGRELEGKTELLEWAIAQRGRSIRGFDQAFYSGVSTLEMTRVVGDVIEHHPSLGGLVQLAMPEPISKFDLLQIANEAFALDLRIERDSSFATRPTLDGSTLARIAALRLPDWMTMMNELAAQERYYGAASVPADGTDHLAGTRS